MVLRMIAALGFLALAGCVAQPQRVLSPEEAQAFAQCRVQSDTLPTSQNAMSNPWFAAAAQEQFMKDCMAAKGYGY